MDGNRHLSLTANDDGTVTAINRHGAHLTIDPDGAAGLSPLELLLAAVGGCGAVDVALLMRKQRAPITPFGIEVEGLKEDTRMRWLRVTYDVAADVDVDKLERARRKTAEDLCTVSRTLAQGSAVEHVVRREDG
jgi:putative redox protein